MTRVPASDTPIRVASGVSARADEREAADEACERLFPAPLAGVDLAFVFASGHHADRFADVSERVRERLGARHVVGCTGVGVLGAAGDLEGSPGVSVLACSMPGVRVRPFTEEHLIAPDASAEASAARAGEAIGADDDLRAVFVLADPFSVPLVRVLPALSAGRVEREEDGRRKRVGVIVGGMASAARAPGQNALVLDSTVRRHGAVGVSLLGPLRVDAVVSQGCRPIGPTMVVTKARSNLVLQLGGRQALEAVRAVIADLPDADRRLLGGGLFLGRVVDEYKDRFGRGDFLVRHIVGAEESSGAIAVADIMRVGQTVQLHLRDDRTAREDLALLLDAQRLHDPPAGALLFTCNGRGRDFFGEPHTDVRAVQHAFEHAEAGEHKARAGREVGPVDPAIPMGGFFAAGEIGPVGEDTYLHGHTACLALLRSEQSSPG